MLPLFGWGLRRQAGVWGRLTPDEAEALVLGDEDVFEDAVSVVNPLQLVRRLALRPALDHRRRRLGLRGHEGIYGNDRKPGSKESEAYDRTTCQLKLFN